MKRKIYAELLLWKEKGSGKTALLIDGARRVGKSYIVQRFAENEYRSFILIDFNRVPRDVMELFDRYLYDLDTFFSYLSVFFNVKLYEHESLIVFDEVQLCPRARAAIKYLVADGRYDYIETGSLMSIKARSEDIVIPSEERHLRMYPMDFQEFLWAMGEDGIYPLIEKCFQEYHPLGATMHRRVMDLFRQYLLVGGMPQAVAEYASSRSFSEVDVIKRDILNLYRGDIIKFAGGYERKVEAIFDAIPAQLQKHEKRFVFASLAKNARLREYEEAFFWLDDAMMVNICWNSTAPSVGLKLNADYACLKCYMADTGLLISHAFDERGMVSEDIYRRILTGSLEFNEGMIAENSVAQMLTAKGQRLYFYSNYDKNAVDRMEIDFLIAKNKITNRHNISPLEVKSGKNYTFCSLKKFTAKFAQQLHVPYVIHASDLMVKDGYRCIPFYMVPLL